MVTAALDEVVIQKQAWKAGLVNNYAAALIRRALELAYTPTPYFNNDDVPEVCQPGDKTTVGAAFRMLIAAGIIVPWRGTIEPRGIYGGMRSSARPENNGHRNQLYVLTMPQIGREWLNRHGIIPPPNQTQMTMW